MLTASQCKALASEYKSLARQPDVSDERAATLVNIARSLVGLATQLDRLAANMRDNARPNLRDNAKANLRDNVK